MSILEEQDDRGRWEQPPQFDREAENRDFAVFVEAMKMRVGSGLSVETGNLIQDASFHSRIAFSGGLLRFSNFGRMIAFAPDSEVPEGIRAAVAQLAQTYGYVLVPTAELESSYPHDEGARFGVKTWWIRYFDYL